MGMRLYAVGIKDLHHAAEVDALHEIVDIRVPNVMAEDEKGLLDVSGLSQRYYQVSQVGQTRVHLDHYHGCVAGQRTERLLVVHPLLGIRFLYMTSDFRYFVLRQGLRACVGGRGRTVPTIPEKPATNRALVFLVSSQLS